MKSPPFARDAVTGEGANKNQSNTASFTSPPSPVATNLSWVDDSVPGIRFDLELPGGLILRGCTLHGGTLHWDDAPARATQWWVAFPGHVHKDRDGKEIHTHIVDFADADAQDRILRNAVAAVREALRARLCQ